MPSCKNLEFTSQITFQNFYHTQILSELFKKCYDFEMDNNIYAISYKMRQKIYSRVRLVLGILVVCVTLISIFMQFVAYPVVSHSEAMSPDISAGNLELVVPLLRNPSRGDVVLVQNQKENLHIVKKIVNSVFLFLTAQKWSPFPDGRRPMLRRVIGMPGDSLYIDKYVVYINEGGKSRPLTEFEVLKKKYDVQIFTAPTNWDINLGAKSGTKEIVLGEDEYFLLGDNRMECADSRLWGPIKKSSIKGKVVFQYFPFSKFRIF